MSITEPFPSPLAIKRQFSATAPMQDFVQRSRQQVRKILSGNDSRWIVIVGPCSIHDSTAALEYATKLRSLAQKTSDSLLIVMRAYYEKSRTSTGWKGLLYDPHIDGTHDILEGMRKTRHILLELARLEVPTASEVLDPLTIPYLSDLLSWTCIGARTATSQIHRQVASGFDMPVGFKNSIDGNMDSAVNGASAAFLPHSYLGINEEGSISVISTTGNPDAHIVLRGSETSGNYDRLSLFAARQKLQQAGIASKLLVDCSHGNSQRQPLAQAKVMHSLIEAQEEGCSAIGGIILESHLEHGQQPVQHPLKYGQSITDACLGWDDTESLLLELHERLMQQDYLAVKP